MEVNCRILFSPRIDVFEEKRKGLLVNGGSASVKIIIYISYRQFFYPSNPFDTSNVMDSTGYIW